MLATAPDMELFNPNAIDRQLIGCEPSKIKELTPPI
jgi:hypothetical protein